MVTNRSGAPDSTASTASTVPAAPTVPTRWPASGPTGRRDRLVAATRSRAAAVPRTSVRGARPGRARWRAARWPAARRRPTRTRRVRHGGPRRRRSPPSPRARPRPRRAGRRRRRRCRAASTAPASSAKVTGRTRTRVSAGLVRSPPAHHPTTQSTPRKAETTQPPPCATTGASTAAPSTRSTASSSLPQRRARCRPAERDQAGEHEPRRRRDPAVAAGDGHDVEVGRGCTGGDQGHGRAADRLPGAPVALPAAHPDPRERGGERGAGGDPRARARTTRAGRPAPGASRRRPS